jgi:hypothetical protein
MLMKEKKQQQNKSPKNKDNVRINKDRNKDKKRKEEKVNWKEIMGMNRDVYTRRNGAIRRK